MFPLTRVPFWYQFFEPQPSSLCLENCWDMLGLSLAKPNIHVREAHEARNRFSGGQFAFWECSLPMGCEKKGRNNRRPWGSKKRARTFRLSRRVEQVLNFSAHKCLSFAAPNFTALGVKPTELGAIAPYVVRGGRRCTPLQATILVNQPGLGCG